MINKNDDVTEELISGDKTDTNQQESLDEPEMKFGFKVIDGNTYYFYDDGSKAIGCAGIDGNMYFFNNEGVMSII